MGADHPFTRLHALADRGDRDDGGVGGEDAVLRRRLLHLGENALLEIGVFRYAASVTKPASDTADGETVGDLDPCGMAVGNVVIASTPQAARLRSIRAINEVARASSSGSKIETG